MDSIDALFEALRQAAPPEAANAVEHLVLRGQDDTLARINALAFAADIGLDEDAAIAALLHAAQLGILEMSWNILCPSCGGVLDANATLKTVRQAAYHCAFCALDSEPVLDDTVEVTFGVSPRVRRIPAHDPEALAFWDYHRQVFFGSGLVFTPGPEFHEQAARSLAESAELQPGERIIFSLRVGPGSLILFDPVTHTAHAVTVDDQPTSGPQELTVVLGDAQGTASQSNLHAGTIRVTFDNRSHRRTLPGVFLAGSDLDALLGQRRPFLTAKRLLSHQTFRDIFRTDTLAVDQRLKILNLTFLFTDLKGSTELYDRVGDLVAYDMVRAHFRVLNDIVAAEGGAVVKTIGDAVMATFPTPQRALAAAFRMREAMRLSKERQDAQPLMLKIGLHAGPCLAVNLNDRQDYFGQTVNIASRVQELSLSDSIFATEAIVSGPDSERLIAANGARGHSQSRNLRGVGAPMAVVELK